MAELIAIPPFAGLLPLEIGATRASAWALPAITSLAPFRGQHAQVSAALERQLGIGLPAITRWHANESAAHSVVWGGYGQYFVMGPAPQPIAGAAMTDQSDAWAGFVLEGSQAAAVLARLTALDLRASHFAPGHAARTQLGHMNALLLCRAPERYEALVFRSMVQTAAHEVATAMRYLSARQA